MSVSAKHSTRKQKGSKKRVTRSREAQAIVIAGIPGTGKSTKCKELVIKSKSRALIILKSDTPIIWRDYKRISSEDAKALRSFSGIRKIILDKEDKKTVFRNIYHNYRGGTLVFDDARKYLKANIEACPDGFMDFFVDKRHIGTDIYVVCHGPTQIPKGIFDYVNFAWLSRTNRLINPRDFPIDDPEYFHEMQIKINQAYDRIVEKGGKRWGHFKMLKLG